MFQNITKGGFDVTAQAAPNAVMITAKMEISPRLSSAVGI